MPTTFRSPVWAALALMVAGPAAQAAVTAFTIDQTSPYGTFRGVEYLRMQVTVQGALKPDEAFADLSSGTRGPDGQVMYRTRVVLVAPNHPEQGNGALLLDVPNRGLPIANALYNSPQARPLAVGSPDPGIGFLQNQRFSIASVQWELGEGIEAPRFVDAGGVSRYVESVGFAAVRDVAVFLRSGGAAQGNPLAGAIQQVYGVGYSQTARFLKSFVQLGFNGPAGRPVFDGVHLFAAAGGMLPLNRSGPGPKSVSGATPGYATPDLRGVHEEPYTYGDLVASLQMRGLAVPRIVVAHTSTDYYTGRASLTRTGPRGTADLPLPEPVRMYDIAGAGHLNIRQQDAACAMPHGQLDWTPPLRAMLLNLHAWASSGTQPPASQLMALAPRPDDARVLPPAAHMAGATLQVPRTDADGNPAEGGVRMPDLAAPLGTHGAANQPNTRSVCRLAGSWQPFAATTALRPAGDNRPTLQERYPGGLDQYLGMVRRAADQLVDSRLLLPDDAAVLVDAAASQPLFAPSTVPDIFR